MRAAALLVAVIGLAIGPVAIRSVSAASERVVLGHASNVIQVVEGCGAGRHWVPRHRDAAGRWIGGHCEAN
jgi:hypothetical protein